MITEDLYREYLAGLLAANQNGCRKIVADLLDHQIQIEVLYLELFQRALYEVGAKWERAEISVTVEHLATAITESLFTMVHPRIFSTPRCGKSIVVSCAANELHQIGGKMIADFFELRGWDSQFLGANAPEERLLRAIDERTPEIVGLSLPVGSNFPKLLRSIEWVRQRHADLPIIVGGQGIQYGEIELVSRIPHVRYVNSLARLDVVLAEE
jgi:MerR family transcriptional regulator, light-induced transcriptional regulator